MKNKHGNYLRELGLLEIAEWLKKMHMPPNYLELLVSVGADDMESLCLLQEEDLAKIPNPNNAKKIAEWMAKNRPENYLEVLSYVCAEQMTDDEEGGPPPPSSK